MKMFLENINVYLPSIITVLIFVWGVRHESRLKKIERRHKFRIQFNVEANFIDMQKEYCVTEFLVTLENQGFTEFTLDEIKLKVQGLKLGANIDFFEKNYSTSALDSIVNFPIRLIDTNMLARLKKDKKEDSDNVTHFLEPGVIQRFTYVAAIPENIEFILVTASFNYHKNSEHTAKRVFSVKVGN